MIGTLLVVGVGGRFEAPPRAHKGSSDLKDETDPSVGTLIMADGGERNLKIASL